MENRRECPETGILYVTATPIGNLRDITMRAVEVLSSVALVAAEDTRRTRILLNSLGIEVKCISCREHNENRAAVRITGHLCRGEDVAFVTDAGTPGISDPGGRLVKQVRDNGFRVVPVPGPSAAVTAMSVAGFSSSSFHFAGFLPSRRSWRKAALKELVSITSPVIFFESPHRILDTLHDMMEIMGDRHAFMGREMTKLHETYFSGMLSELENRLHGEMVKGEITIVVDGCGDPGAGTMNEGGMKRIEQVIAALSSFGMSGRDISSLVADITGLKKSSVYEMVNRLNNKCR